MNSSDKVSKILASPNPSAIVEAVKRECDALAVALLACSADGVSVIAAVPAQHRDADAWQACAAYGVDVMTTGLPIERREAGGQAEPVSLMICPVDASASTRRGVIAVRRIKPFSTDEVDFVRLLGIELGAAGDALFAAGDAGLNRRRAAGE